MPDMDGTRGVRALGAALVAVLLFGCGRTALERDGSACSAAVACADVGASCGPIDDGCGHTVECGSCPEGQLCGGAGVANVCAPYCTDGWCWQRPLPQGNTLTDAWLSPSGQLWTVGPEGTLLRWAGEQWFRQPPMAGAPTLTSVWGAADDDVWVGALEGLWHWDGESWTAAQLSAPRVLTLRGSSSTDVWATTLQAVLHWDGTQWTESSPLSFTVNSVWVPGPNDVWLAGDLHAMHFDGTRWNELELPGQQLLDGIAGTADDDVWAVGGAIDSTHHVTALVEHWDGAHWQVQSTPSWPTIEATSWRSVVARSRSDVWVAGDEGDVIHFDGTRWESVPTGTAAWLNRLAAGDQLWAVGQGGTVLRWTDGAWHFLEGERGSWLDGLWGTSADDVWTTGADGFAAHFDGSAWVSTVGLNEPEHDLGVPGTAPGLSHLALFGSAPDDVWSVDRLDAADTQLQHFDGVSWSLTPTGPFARSPMILHAGCSVSPTDAWAVGTTVLHWDGSRWSELSGGWPFSTGGLNAAACLSANDVWMVGALGTDPGGGQVLHWDGHALTVVFAFAANLDGVWASRSDDVWVVGLGPPAQGVVLHFDGGHWSTSDWTSAVAGFDINDRWAQFTGVTGAGRDVWVTTNQGFLLHFDGHAWARVDTGTSGLLTTMWRASNGALWVAGMDDAILYHPP